MNTLFFSPPSSLLLPPPPPPPPPPPSSPSFTQSLPPHLHLLQPLHHRRHYHHLSSSSSRKHSILTHCTPHTTEGPIEVVSFEELVEKDWSFMDSDPNISPLQQTQTLNRIISAGNIGGGSKVLISIGTEEFVDRVVDSSSSVLKPDDLLVVHDSLFVLAGVKEKHDRVRCWQGEIIYVPEKWGPFQVVFLYYLPALPFELQQVFQAISQRCVPGARLIISHPQGREVAEQQQKEYSDVVVSDLPDKKTLESVAADHSFEITEFVDEAGLYLAVLNYCK